MNAENKSQIIFQMIHFKDLGDRIKELGERIPKGLPGGGRSPPLILPSTERMMNKTPQKMAKNPEMWPGASTSILKASKVK